MRDKHHTFETRLGTTPQVSGSGYGVQSSQLSKHERVYGYAKEANKITEEQKKRDVAAKRRNERDRRINHLEKQLSHKYASNPTGPFGKRAASLQPNLYERSGACGAPLIA